MSFKIRKIWHDGMALTEAAVAEIKRLYLGDEMTITEIGVQFGIPDSAVSRLARRNGWPMRTRRRGYQRTNSPASAPKALELVVHRICDVVGAKLAQMEAQMQSGTLNSEDFERDAKSVGQMLGSFEKATAAGANGEKKHKPKAAIPVPVSDSAASDDAERLHREIIERFERIQRRRNAEAGSG